MHELTVQTTARELVELSHNVLWFFVSLFVVISFLSSRHVHVELHNLRFA